jgi:undecaprenyl diphosphate synthase
MHSMSLTRTDSNPFHVAIIMDGNGRWAEQRNKPRFFGHRAGAESVRRAVEAAPDLGITTLTLYAFSSDNWKRPAQEVKMLMRLFQSYLQVEIKNLKKNNVRLNFIGRRDRFDKSIVQAMTAAEKATGEGNLLNLRLAVDYSSRDQIISAARQISANSQISREDFGKLLSGQSGNPEPYSNVDLLIRTGGEQRLSDFLLWECAYAELHFTPVMWPEFDAEDLQAAVEEFHRRERRFGAVPSAAVV